MFIYKRIIFNLNRSGKFASSAQQETYTLRQETSWNKRFEATSEMKSCKLDATHLVLHHNGLINET